MAQFAPHEGVEIKTTPIPVLPGEMLYLVLDAAPGGSRGFTHDIDQVNVSVLTKADRVP